MSQIILKNLRGINATKAKLQLQAGEPSGLQNVRNRPLNTWTKRQGVEPVETSSDPYMGIFDVELDDVIIPVIIKGGDWTFYPSSLPVSENHPLTAIDADADYVLWAVEKTMRAMQEKILWTGTAGYAFPNAHFDSAGVYNAGGTAPDSVDAGGYYLANARNTYPFPQNGFYKYDLAFTDQYFGNPAGTYAASLVQHIYTAYSNLVSTNLYIQKIEGETAISYFDSAYYNSILAPNVPTITTYKQSIVFIRNEIRKLLKFKVGVVNPFVETLDKDSPVSKHAIMSGFYGVLTVATCNAYLAGMANELDESAEDTGTPGVLNTVRSEAFQPPYYGYIQNPSVTTVTDNTLEIMLAYANPTIDLSNYVASGTCNLYLIANDRYSTPSLITNCPVTADDKYHVLSDVVPLGALYTGATTYPTGSVPVVSAFTDARWGWTGTMECVITPNFSIQI